MEFPAITLAIDGEGNILRCQEILNQEIEGSTKLKVRLDLTTDYLGINLRSWLLQYHLSNIIERGDFKGTCSLCRDHLIGSSETS